MENILKRIIQHSPEQIIANGETLLSLNFLKNVEELLTQGFAYFDFPRETQEMLPQLFYRFEEFINDKTLRASYEALREPWNTEEADVGVIVRNGGEHDKKIHINFKNSIYELARSPSGAETPKFLLEANALYRTCKAFSHRIAKGIDLINPELDILSRIVEADELQTLRLLHYNENCEIQAKNHTDQGSFTLVLGDSIPGLKFTNGTKRFLHTNTSGKILVFFGRKFEKRCSELGYRSGELPSAIPHYVEVTESDRNKSRNSAVYFVHDRTNIENFSPSLLPRKNVVM